jgi:hypothetical protein
LSFSPGNWQNVIAKQKSGGKCQEENRKIKGKIKGR